MAQKYKKVLFTRTRHSPFRILSDIAIACMSGIDTVSSDHKQFTSLASISRFISSCQHSLSGLNVAMEHRRGMK